MELSEKQPVTRTTTIVPTFTCSFNQSLPPPRAAYKLTWLLYLRKRVAISSNSEAYMLRCASSTFR